MSFILDALKRSEAERHRQSGPTLIDLRTAPPRRRTPLWLVPVGLVLLANLGVLVAILLRGPTPPDTMPAMVPASATPAPDSPATPAVATNVLPPPTLLPEPVQPPPPRPQPAAPAPLPASPTVPAAAVDDALLPSATDLRLAGVGVPELRLALHVYDAQAANRYVLLNGQRLQEGDSTSDGVRLERVVPTGVVLSYRSSRFRLEAGQ